MAAAEPIGDFARLDFDRSRRTGFGETVYAAGKTVAQLVAILEGFKRRRRRVLATRVSPAQAAAVAAAGLKADYDVQAQTLMSRWGGAAKPLKGTVAVVTGGTADWPYAEEAARTARFFGARVERFYDVGVAGIQRLFAVLPRIRRARAVIVAAGMEGALAGVVAGLVPAPVIALPTPVGSGSGAKGLVAALAMLNACAEGVSVVNIGNGFGAAAVACRMLRLSR